MLPTDQPDPPRSARRTGGRVRRCAVAAVGAALVLASCSSGGGSDGSAATSTTDTTTAAVATTTGASTSSVASTSTGATTASTASTTAPGSPGAACTGTAPVAPSGATLGTVADVDGDGKPEKAWLGATPGQPSSVRFGIDASRGGGAVADFDSASPVARTVLVANADAKGPTEVFFDDGRQVELYAFVDCAIEPVTNPQGKTYTFSLGFGTIGTGVGCVDTGEGQRLVGLDGEGTGSDAKTVRWSRTVVELSGTTAHNGTTTRGTYTRPGDDAKIALLDGLTCGKLTATADGLRFGG